MKDLAIRLADETYRAFPQALKKLRVYMGPSLVYDAGCPNVHKNNIATPYSYIRSMGKFGGFARMERHSGALIVLHDKSLRFQHWGIFALNHELGHFIMPFGGASLNGPPASKALRETSADIFAVLRHLQIFPGSEKWLKRELIESRVKAVVEEEQYLPHYTSNAVIQTLAMTETRDITKLSLQQTVRLAQTIALKNCMSQQRLSHIRSAFQERAQKGSKTPEHIARVRAQHPHNKDIQQAAQRYARHLHNQRIRGWTGA